MTRKIEVTENENKERLDKFLCRQFPGFSRSHLQKLIKRKLVLVNAKAVLVHHFLKTGDLVEINPLEPAKIDLTPDAENPLAIVFEDENFLVINKEAGLAVHPAESCREKTLANRLLSYLPDLKNVGDDPARPGIVHRLDKDVSGLMVVAKNQKSFLHLKSQFKTHRVKKEYLALVYGEMNKDEGMIDFPIARGKEGKFVARPQNQPGKEAVTQYNLREKLSNYSLLKITTLTGRTHQIRVHLTAIDHPILGDEIYKNKKLKTKIGIDRLFLHASKLAFLGLDGKLLEFNLGLPPELEKILAALRELTK
jgi:23S rRNA pseudouridine1911/1915/1917 synthase